MRFALLRKLAVGLVVGLGAGVGLALVLVLSGSVGPREAQATHDASGTVHACVSRYTGQTRIVPQGQAPNCNASEFLVELGAADAVAALQAQVDALDAQLPDCLAEEAGDAIFTNCDVEIRNGNGSTSTANGKGNLIVGYNENSEFFNRDGSHNIVVGQDHGYSSYGGLVAGFQNIISGPNASVSGGAGNQASGSSSSVSGGLDNEASGSSSSVSGGVLNDADGQFSSVSGGGDRSASGQADWVAGALFEDS